MTPLSDPKAKKTCRGFKGKSCVVTEEPQDISNFYKAPRNKGGLWHTCKACDKARYKDYYQQNRENVIQKTSEYNKKNPEVNRAAVKKHYHNNKDYYLHKVKIWREINPHKSVMYASKRRAAIKSATPDWLTEAHKREIDNIFWMATDLRSVSGEDYHVDHIVPLQGKNVCGLHVPWNLQLLPSDLNFSKGNKLDVTDTL